MIRTFPIYRLLGSLTTQRFISIVRATLNEQDNQRLQDLTIRMYINAAKDELQEKLLATSSPAYDYIFHAQEEELPFLGTVPANTLSYADYNATIYNNLNNKFNIRHIDLGQEVPFEFVNGSDTGFYGNDFIVPIDHIRHIRSVSYLGHGSGKQMAYEELLNIAHSQSDIWGYSVIWSLVADRLVMYNGNRTIDVPDTATQETFRKGIDYEIFTTRRVYLDDLLMPDESKTYNLSIDVPSDSYKLLTMMVQKSCLESLGKIVLPQIDQATDASAQGQLQTTMANQQIGVR